MTSSSFAITWDYRCPYARNLHEHVVTALQAGEPWDVQFIAFSLDQAHVDDDQPPVWDAPERYPALAAVQAGIVVRDRFPDRFLSTHLALFAARHDQARDLRKREVLAEVLEEQGVDAAAVLEAIDDGWPLQQFRKEHEALVADYKAFGVPTVIVDDHAAFIRLMPRPGGDVAASVSRVRRVLELTGGWSELNELKHTTIAR